MSAKVHFFLRTDRPTPEGSAQIYMVFVLTRTKRKKYATGKYIQLKRESKKLSPEEIIRLSPEERDRLYYWDADKQRATKGCQNSEKINHYLATQEKKAGDIILKYELLNKPLTLEGFKGEYFKESSSSYFLQYFTKEIERRKDGLSPFTVKNYISIVNKIDGFRKNILLTDIDHKFLIDFENYSRKSIKDGGCGNNEVTTFKNLKILRTLLLIAIKNGDLLEENYPFKTFKIKEVDSELSTRDFLEPEDLAVIEKMYCDYKEPEKPTHHHSAKDWRERNEAKKLSPGEYKTLERFLFCCYTGLRFSDMTDLTKANIHGKYVTNPGTQERVYRHYIELKMNKTRTGVVIPLIEKALKIIEKNNQVGLVFESISNQKVNEHLKQIQKKAELEKYLTFHVARHSFATICFIYGIPERVGQKLLGHRNRKFTEIYTHLSQSRLFYEMDKFNNGLNSQDNNILKLVPDTDEEKMREILPILKSFGTDKLDKLRELIKLIA